MMIDVLDLHQGGRKMKYKLFILTLIMLLLITPAFGAISKDEASEAAAKYQRNGEVPIVYGPYTYMDQPYYYIEFRNEDIKTGVIFIDGVSKKPVTDREISEKIVYSHYILNGVDSESLTQIEQASLEFRKFSQMTKDLNSNSNENQQKIASLDPSEKKKLDDTLNALNKINNSVTNIADKYDVFVATGKDGLGGNKSYDNAKKMMDTSNSMAQDFNEFSLVAQELSSINEGFDMSEVLTQMESFSSELKKLERDSENAILSDVASAESRTNATPAFSILFSVCSLLIVGVLIKRRK